MEFTKKQQLEVGEAVLKLYESRKGDEIVDAVRDAFDNFIFEKAYFREDQVVWVIDTRLGISIKEAVIVERFVVRRNDGTYTPAYHLNLAFGPNTYLEEELYNSPEEARAALRKAGQPEHELNQSMEAAIQSFVDDNLTCRPEGLAPCIKALQVEDIYNAVRHCVRFRDRQIAAYIRELKEQEEGDEDDYTRGKAWILKHLLDDLESGSMFWYLEHEKEEEGEK